jgi:actin-related protein 5
MFEGYGVPSVCFGISPLFGHFFNVEKNRVDSSCLLIEASNEACTIIPVLDGVALSQYAARVDLGAARCKSFLEDIMALRYPQFRFHGNMFSTDDLFHSFSLVAENYSDTLRMIDACELNETSVSIQVDVEDKTPKELSSGKRVISEEKRQEMADRMRRMAAEKRAAKEEQDDALLESYEGLLRKKEDGEMTQEDFRSQLESGGFDGEADFLKILNTLRKKVQIREAKKADQPSLSQPKSEIDLYPLLNVPDDQLTPEELKEKRRQKLLKGSADARARKKKEKEIELEQKQQEIDAEQKAFENDPSGFIAALVSKSTELMEIRRQKMKLASEGFQRKSAFAQSKMKLVSSLASSSQGTSDTFGASDQDWEVYRTIQGKASDVGLEETSAITEIESKIRQFEPNYLFDGSASENKRQKVEPFNRFRMDVERFRVPELLFQPSMIGIDQCGIGEALQTVVSRLSPPFQEKILRVGDLTFLI